MTGIQAVGTIAAVALIVIMAAAIAWWSNR